MNPDRWRRIEALVHEALDRAPDAREAFLDEACAGDVELRREVGALTAQASRTGGFLRQSTAGASSDTGPARTAGAALALAVGSTLGPYEVVGALGAGGMGEVYRARDARLGRDVAIKVPPLNSPTTRSG